MTSPETTGPTSAVQATGHRSATPAIVLALVEAEFNGLVNCPVAEEGWGPTDPVAVASDLAAVVLVPIDPVEEVSVRTALVAEASAPTDLAMVDSVPIVLAAVASVLIVQAEATVPLSEEGRQVALVDQVVGTLLSVVGTTSTLATMLAAAMLATVSETTSATATGETGIGATEIGG